MDRAVMSQLLAWKSSARRKPLMLLGARQVGKTWLLRRFGEQNYARTVHLSLDRSATARAVFDGDLAVNKVVADLAVIDGGGPIDPSSTLIILDEIQEAPHALECLKVFAESGPEYHVACAGSLLGVAMHQGSSFPVGKVNLIQVWPLSFLEFLDAVGEESLADLIRQSELERLAPFHDALVTQLRSYLFVGGMPEAVASYEPSKDYVEPRRVHRELLAAYDQDFSKYAPPAEVPRLRALFRAVPEQLARENRRFVYAKAQRGARSKTMELALQWLVDAGLVHQVRRAVVPRLPLASYADETAFKLFMIDVGLTGAAVGLEPAMLLRGTDAFTEYKGALTEQFVLQELVASGATPYYWTSRSGGAEVDFVLQESHDVVPVEVKASVNLQAKSLRTYMQQWSPRLALRLSLRPYRKEDHLTNLPLYAVGALAAVLKDGLSR